MSRFCMMVATALLLPVSSVFAQTADTVEVTLTSKTATFNDQYQFVDYSTAMTGELITGGITTTATVTRLVPQTQTITVNRPTVQFVNGRITVVFVPTTQTITIPVPVTETTELVLPEVTGTWYTFGGRSAWLINSRTADGIVIGAGTRNGTTVQGSVTFVSFTSPVPSGVYQVTTAVAPPMTTGL